MKCYVHPETDATGLCTACGRAICDACAVNLKGKLVCRECLETGRGAIGAKYDPNTVFLIELLAGFFGFLGIGYIYVGRMNDGVLRLILWLLYDIIAVVIAAFAGATIIGLVCLPIPLAIQVGVPLWSATTLRNELQASPV